MVPEVVASRKIIHQMKGLHYSDQRQKQEAGVARG
jgi:hypothetical protein